ncbi:MAG: putative cytosolic protein [Deltaproteobacteria bacterium]|nr:putative cytosolic protein [Deltaproteobacteria bacterium]
MVNEQRLNALEVALNNEVRERDFYLKNAARTKNSAGKAMFDRIAQDEVEHYERLKRLHEEWAARGSWPETVPLTINQTNVRDILVATLKNIDASEPCDASDLEAVKIAAEFEEKGVIFYKDLAASSADPREKAFFELLSSIEYEHYLSLRDAEEYFENPSAWFIKVEHPMWDGG